MESQWMSRSNNRQFPGCSCQHVAVWPSTQKTDAETGSHTLMWEASRARHKGHKVMSHSRPPWSTQVGDEKCHATSLGGLDDADVDTS